MGQIGAALRALGDSGTLPDAERGTYFAELLTMGWFELLCCPMAMGATVLVFEPLTRVGGKPVYKVKARLSYSEHVPRFQVNVVADDGSNTNWVVGNMEKQETHLRTKPGEFVRVQIWKLMTNSMDIIEGDSCLHGTRAFPSPSDIQIMHMAITTQAKLDIEEGEEAVGAVDSSADPRNLPGPKLNPATERWVQTITVDDPNYQLQTSTCRTDRGPPTGLQSRLSDIDALRVRHKGKKVAIGRKQRFAGAWGLIEQPYLGVQIRPSEDRREEENVPGLYLDTKGLMLLLMCMAWSEETMLSEHDKTANFADAMRAQPGQLGSASQLGVPVAWDLDDVKNRVAHRHFAKFYEWDSDSPRTSQGWEETNQAQILMEQGTGAVTADED